MRGSVRLASGGEIDRSRPLRFTFDGRPMTGYAGDTVASALLASGVSIVGRSFKYHRPRGIFSAGIEEPNALLDLRLAERHDPICRATVERLADGMALCSVHASGTAASDRLAIIDRFARFIPAAFYYKSFMWPSWRLYEDRIRAMAGIGMLDPRARRGLAAEHHRAVDLCVVGGGPAGLAAALAGMGTGKSVLIADMDQRLGGSLLARDGEVAGMPGRDWAGDAAVRLRRGGALVLTQTMAFGLYDHNALGLVERTDTGERLWRVRAREIVLATGAIERPMLFANNDRPGVMLAGAVLSYLRRHGVRAGERVVIATANDSTHELSVALRAAGAEVLVVDARKSDFVTKVVGKDRVEGVRLADGTGLDADLVAVSGGFSPALHLYAHAKGVVAWSRQKGAFVPRDKLDGLSVAGAANGAFDLAAALAEGWGAAGGETGAAPRTSEPDRAWSAAPVVDPEHLRGRVWVDLQNDVTTKDIVLAHRESFSAIEHLKRYTTLGMATDQGKTSNVNGLAVLASLAGREMGEAGVTTFRPPYAPVSFVTIAAMHRGELSHPVRRLPVEPEHRAERAHFREYGGILRPAWYGAEEGAIARECLAARSRAIVFDGSPLGKIEIVGPDAAKLIDFIFYTRMSTLANGRLRYGLMLTEGGAIFDDGVVLRLAEDRFIVSCSSSHVPAVAAHLEAWRQDIFDRRRVFIHDTTASWATITIGGPGSMAVVRSLELGSSIDDADLPHMGFAEGRFGGRPVRIARVSFIGERSYEISVPASLGGALWAAARSAGAEPMGVEALSVLRLEKGFIIVGADTDGETMPHDIGFAGPRDKRRDAYVGDRSLFTEDAMRVDRRQLVGLRALDRRVLPPGAHAIVSSGRERRSIGFVTSSAMSPALGYPVALGLVENGRMRMGEVLDLEDYGAKRTGGSRHQAEVVAPCFLDGQGARLHA
ncbi:MAG: 2Fe-2S iron-sulfur cluster-binding protein [Hyphomicrobiaceae bacterium]